MNIRRSRTPLLSSVRELIRISGSNSENISRREFLKRSATAAAVIAATAYLPRNAFAKDPPRIAIVGAGIAGLNAAYSLRKAGIIAKVYEGSSRTGGRIFTAKNVLADGLTTEFGGEFIDSDHSEMLALAHEFGLELRDRKDSSSLKRAYLFGGKLRTESEVISAINPYLEKIRSDADSLPKYFDFENPGNASTLDRLSLAEYFGKLEISGWIKDLLETAYVTEYGLELAEQSALNLITLISSDISRGFEIFGSSDERYVTRGGNSRFTEELSARLPDQIDLSHKLESIRSKDTGFTLTFNANDSAKDIHADIVLLAIPFPILREVEMKTELPVWKRNAIHELGYGSHTKVMTGFTKRLWHDGGYTGEIFSDESFQLAWDNSQLQPGDPGGLTSFTGGNLATEAGKGTAGFQSEKFIKELRNIFPGAAEASTGKNARFNWTTNPFTKGSYSVYKPGQWTTIRGAERKSVGNLFFAGEHTSLEFQGFMNGGAETGKKAAEEILTLLK